MGEAALAVAKGAEYYSAGTVEFLVDKDQNFYFLEMNTRIQVEHTVTEMVTGTDLVLEQIRIAQGKELQFSQEDIKVTGHAIQCRINAEDPANNFMPSPGRLDYYLPPGVLQYVLTVCMLWDTQDPPYYDPMVAKLICHGKDRDHAIAISKRALREFYIGGIKTTIPMHLHLLEDENFLNHDYDLHYMDQRIDEGSTFESHYQKEDLTISK